MSYPPHINRRTSIQLPEQSVLASNNSAKPVLYEYRGLDDEDFNLFKNTIKDYIAIKNISHESSKLAILRAKLIGKARQDFESLYPDIETPGVTLEGALNELSRHFNTADVIERKRNMFFNIQQLPQESPHNFENRVYETANNAGITDQTVIESRFKFGLLPEIIDHCTSLGAVKTEEFSKYAQGYWNTHMRTLIPYDNQNNSYPGIRPIMRNLNIRDTPKNDQSLNTATKEFIKTEIKEIFLSSEIQASFKDMVKNAVNTAIRPSNRFNDNNNGSNRTNYNNRYINRDDRNNYYNNSNRNNNYNNNRQNGNSYNNNSRRDQNSRPVNRFNNNDESTNNNNVRPNYQQNNFHEEENTQDLQSKN